MTPAEGQEGADPSQAAFEAVMLALPRRDDAKPTRRAPNKGPFGRNQTRQIVVNDAARGTLRRSAKGLRIDIEDGPVADWLETEAETVLTELHVRWMRKKNKRR